MLTSDLSVGKSTRSGAPRLEQEGASIHENHEQFFLAFDIGIQPIRLLSCVD